MDVVLFMLFKKRKDLNLKLDKLIYTLEKSNIEELLNILGSKKKIIARNLLAGIFRGVGIGIGITIITAILIGISRLYLFVHFPTDVLAGAILGTIIALSVYYFGNKIENRIKKKEEIVVEEKEEEKDEELV